jgi:hypothetical protein
MAEALRAPKSAAVKASAAIARRGGFTLRATIDPGRVEARAAPSRGKTEASETAALFVDRISMKNLIGSFVVRGER